MKHLNKITSLALIFLITSAYTQKVESISEEETFLNWYFQNYLLKSKNDPPILYTDAIHTGSLTAIKDDIIKDTLVDLKNSYANNEFKECLILTKSEKLYINDQLDKMTGKSWTENLMKNSQKLNNDSLEILIGKQGLGWLDKYYEKYKTGFYSFSKPIFLRNNTICIFSFDYSCGILCAYGETAIYFKHNGEWSKWLIISDWIS
jgi:hypothetical protein